MLVVKPPEALLSHILFLSSCKCVILSVYMYNCNSPTDSSMYDSSILHTFLVVTHTCSGNFSLSVVWLAANAALDLIFSANIQYSHGTPTGSSVLLHEREGSSVLLHERKAVRCGIFMVQVVK